MFTRPSDVSDTAVIEALQDGWGVAATEVEYAPVGFGSHHWRATTANGCWFVSVDDHDAKRRVHDEPFEHVRGRLMAALAAARALRDSGFEFVVAPEPTLARGVLNVLTDRYAVALYPLVDGAARPYSNYESREERLDVLVHLAALHAAPRSCRESALADDLAIANRESRRADARIERHLDALGMRAVRRADT